MSDGPSRAQAEPIPTRAETETDRIPTAGAAADGPRPARGGGGITPAGRGVDISSAARGQETAAADNGGPGAPQPRWSMRSLALPIAAGVALVLLVAGVAYWRLNIGLVKTDNAQTVGDLAPISARIPGTVIKLNVDENRYVTAGTVLVELDPTNYRLAVVQAKASLAGAHSQVQAAQAALAAQERQYSASLSAARGSLETAQPGLPQAQAQLRMDEGTTAAQVAQAREAVTTAAANVQAAKAALDTANSMITRDRQLLAQGAIAAQQMDTDTAAYAKARADYQAAQDALRQAQASLASAEANRERVAIARQAVAVSAGQIAQAKALLQQAQAGETLVRQRAQELAAAEAQAAQAAAAVQTAEVNLSYTVVRAPADGWVTNRTVQIGQVVQTNQPLMSITLAHHIWVVANIKEKQLGGIRVGNPVRITVDAYRGRTFHGHVESIGSATGSTTALLPPDNATGNFVKVVQLVPIRIALDPQDAPEPQLQVGLSAEVAIDTRRTGR